MLQAAILGPAISPGQILYERRDPGPSKHPNNHFNLFHEQHQHDDDKPIGRTLQAIETTSNQNNEDQVEYNEEELVWYGKTVIWSRGSQIFRKYTYDLENEDVTKAVFTWFKPDLGSNSWNRHKGKQVIKLTKYPGTFGPFHNSQNEKWGTPKLSSSSSSSSSMLNSSRIERTLVVFLQTRAHVYYSSGEDVVVNLPFPIHDAWPISTLEGGLIIQRALEKREIRKLDKEKRKSGYGSLLKGMMEHSSMTILDDLMDLEDDNSTSLPRLYTLDNPFDEFKMIVEGRVDNGFNQQTGKLKSQTHPIKSSSTIIHVCQNPYPFIITHDSQSNEIIFYRKTKVPDEPEQPTPISPLNPRTMRPEDLLSNQPEPPILIIPQSVRAGRPSLHRNPSSFGPSKDRRVSGISDPLDRTQRRVPRMSRNPAQDQHILTDELQATLDPAPIIPPPSSLSKITKRKSRGLSILSTTTTTTTTTQETNRRTSGANSSFNLKDLHDTNGKMGLAAMAEIDLRETTMMMGLERDEIDKRSDLVLDRVWAWKTPYTVKPENLSVFISDDLSSSSVMINIHISQPNHTPQLYSFHAQFRSNPYQHFSITPSPPTECLSAIPLISTRHKIVDTIILSRTGTLSIMTSGGRQIALQVPSQTREGHEEVARKLASSLRMAVNDNHARAHSERRIVKLADSVGSRFTVNFEDGESVKINADFRIKHLLIKQCLEALSCVLSAQEFFSLKRELIACIQRLPTIQQNEDGPTWRTFKNTILTVLQIEVERCPTTAHEILERDNQESSDPTTRRLAHRIRQKHRKLPTLSMPETISSETLGLETTAPIMLALHLVAQDLRLSSKTLKYVKDVVKLVSYLASKVGKLDWKDYWARLLPDAVSRSNPIEGIIYDTALLDQFDVPPDIMTFLHRQLVKRTKPFPSPAYLLSSTHLSEFGHVDPCRQTTLITSIYAHFSAKIPVLARAAAAVKHIIDQGLDEEWISDLPYGIALPILEMIRMCQYNPPKDWDVKMYEITGRWDLGIRANGEGMIQREEHGTDLGPERIPTIKELLDVDNGEMKKLPQSALPHVRFGSDRRVQEVERIMQTTRIRTIAIQDPKGASEADITRYHQTVVNTIANRTLSIPVGQGMLNFGTRSTNVIDVWNIPLIELSVKVGPGKPILKAEIISDSAEWPCFHNGVAAGLAISPDCNGIDSSWIVFNRPNALNAEHGGFLLGLGLTGHLRSLMAYHAFPLLEPRHDFTSVGLLLGLACSYAGSEDLLVTKVLSLHTHALLPLGSMELNASPIIQSSSLVGLGLVYAGSRNLRMAEVALSEVGRKEMANVDGFSDYQESYSFSAAIAFGLIMLGRGGKSTSEVDRRMLTQLRRCILGDLPISSDSSKGRSTVPIIDNNLTGPGATLALGLMYLKTGRKDVADMLSIPQSNFELDQIRPDLLLLRTYARSLILWDEITPTMGWIEDQLPEFIKMANKGHGQGQHKRSSNMELSTELAYLNIVSGACFAIGIKYAGTATELAHTNLMTFYGILNKSSTIGGSTYEGKIKRTAARQCLNLVTLSLSMIMSGTGELSVLRRLRISHGQEGSGINYGTHMAMHMSLGLLFLGKGHYTLGTSNLSIAVLSISFFPRFSNNSNDNYSYPQPFRHLWSLAIEPRCLIAKDIDTLETIYLPIKLKLKEPKNNNNIIVSQKDHNGNSKKKPTSIRQQNLISPTLISPFENIYSIEIDSPRYWPIKLDLSSSSSSLSNNKDKMSFLSNRIIYVKKKLGFLDYNSDPKGNRSLFIRVGSMTGIDLHYDLLSNSKPPSSINNSSSTSTDIINVNVNVNDNDAVSEKKELELENLIKLHYPKSNLILLSRLFSSFLHNKNNYGSNDDQGIGLDEFISIILLECLSLDKPNLIWIYLNMFMNFKSISNPNSNTTSNDSIVDNLNQLEFIQYFYQEIYDKSFNTNSNSSTSNSNTGTSNNQEKRFALIRPSFVSTLIRLLSKPANPSMNNGSTAPIEVQALVKEYLSNSESLNWNDDHDNNYNHKYKSELVKYLWKNKVPPISLMCLLKDKVRQSSINRDILEMKIKDVTENYRRTILTQFDDGEEVDTKMQGILPSGGWKTDSIREAIKVWTE
ncbi:uncharacterized protein L201_005661 [Kwoniella dendrophila CBS 6074]|uniref:Anaphase-promoting complex subunit 1 n=1 Tax=Kwoniella dendrophila CBS 6074 TaxID=1295534 RepID=A0AAX4K0N4_9TREE